MLFVTDLIISSLKRKIRIKKVLVLNKKIVIYLLVKRPVCAVIEIRRGVAGIYPFQFLFICIGV